MATVKQLNDSLTIALARIDALKHDVSVLEAKLVVATDRRKYEALAYRAKLAKATPSAPSPTRNLLAECKALAAAGIKAQIKNGELVRL